MDSLNPVSDEKITREMFNNPSELYFTGNWFFDIGTLGFTSLMEEVYGWSLDDLKVELQKNYEIVYYGYFPFAYLFYHSKIQTNFKEIRNIKNKKRGFIEKLKKNRDDLSKFEKSKNYVSPGKIPKKDLNKIERFKSKISEYENKITESNNAINKSKKDLNDERKDFVLKIESEMKKILSDSKNMFISLEDEINNLIVDFDLNLPNDHRNFFLYNPKKDSFLSFVYLHSLLSEDFSRIKLIRILKGKDEFLNFLRLCKDIELEPDFIINKIESMCQEDKNKKVVLSYFKKLCKDVKKQEELKKFIEKIYKSIKKEHDPKKGLISYEFSPDSTVNPFLYSPSEFFNVSYTKPLTLNEISLGLQLNIPIYLLLLSFGNAFQFFKGENFLFYTNNLDSCYSVNEKIKAKISGIGRGNSLFKITWASVIDELIENKSNFSLENMYLIEFEGIENQKLKNVSYLNITKLQATILIDDTIRGSLNSNIQVESGRNVKWISIIEEFIKNKPLFPIILKYAILKVNKDTNQRVGNKTLFYALSVDAQISHLNNSKSNLFDSNFFHESEDSVFHIKERSKSMNLVYKNVSNLFSADKKDRISYKLISVIKKYNKTAFVNIILKALIEEKGKNPERVKYINNYLFNNILRNDVNWQNYSLAMLFGFL